MTDAQRLLLTLLRRDTRRDAMPAFTAETWNELPAVAPRDLHPYLAWRLPHLVDAAGIPAGVVESLDLARRGAVVGHLPRQALLRRIAGALDGAGVPFVVLKGAALAHLAWPDPTLRPMGDIDISTRADLMDQASAALITSGIPYSARMELRRAAANPMETATVRIFEAPGTQVVLELHGTVRSMAAAAPAWLELAWARATPRDLGGVTALVPHAEDMLTHLAIHASLQHQFAMGFRPLLDISLWLEREGRNCDWPALGERWRRDGCLTWGSLTLVLARDLLAAPVPPDMLDPAGLPAEFAELRELALAQVFEAERTLPPTLARLATTPTVGGRGRWLLHRLTRWYWEGPPGSDRGPLEVLRGAAARISSDLRTKLPAYLRGWRDGSLRGVEFRRRQALAAGRERLLELVRRVEPPRQ
ncbi:MAG: nucleotidyltransferase family protein [Gemmatimonadota bacterium]|nr:nucleotidyltransferase family protein [Gemmatimonadota bacterium]